MSCSSLYSNSGSFIIHNVVFVDLIEVMWFLASESLESKSNNKDIVTNI